MSDAPLIGPYNPDDVLAWESGGPRTARRFLSDVARLADSLPDRLAVLNLLSSRYEFLVGFAAAMLRGHVTLLPQSRAPQTLRRIAGEHRESYCLTNPDEPIDGVEFTRLLRNAPDSANPYLPVVMITGHSERSRVTQARDSGVNEFVVKPLTARALLGRLDSVIMRPRPFIRCKSYFGPDRRRKSDDAYGGPYRRNTDGVF